MTSYKGSVLTTFSKLVEVFGQPDHGPDDFGLDKTTCEWHLCFEDGTVATIYDWKTNNTPFQEYDWHIGGRSSEAVDRVLEVLDATEEKLDSFVADFFQALDKKLGCAPNVSAELLAQFNEKLNKISK
jgi:hypothetical protein